MKKLFTRMLRDILKHPGQFISIVMIIAVGSIMFSGMYSATNGFEGWINKYYFRQNLADGWAYFKGASPDEIAKIAKNKVFSGLEGRYTFDADYICGSRDTIIRFHSITGINKPYLDSGSMPSGSSEILLDKKYAELNSIRIGQSIEFKLEGKLFTFKVTGFCYSPEYAYKTVNSGSGASSNRNFGIAYTYPEGVIDLIKNSSEYIKIRNNIDEKLEDKEKSLKDAEKELINIADGYNEVLIKAADIDKAGEALKMNSKFINMMERKELVSYVMVNNSMEPLKAISDILPMLFFLVAAIITLITMSKTIEHERTQIAVMQAIGISKAKLRLSYLSYTFFASLAGSIMFAYLGNRVIPGILVKTFTSRFSLPQMTVPVYPKYMFITLILAFAFSGLAVLIALERVLKEIPASAMRQKPPSGSKKILFERMGFLWSRFSYSTKLIIRNIFLGKLRIILSSVGVIGSVLLMMAGLSLFGSVSSVVKYSVNSYGYDLSIKYEDAIKDKAALKYEYPVSSIDLSKNIKAVLKKKNNPDIPLQLVESGSSIINQYTPDGKRISFNDRTVIIPESYSRELNINVGDTITVSVKDKDYNFVVTDISLQYLGKNIYIAYPAAKEAGIDTESSSALIDLKKSSDTDRFLNTYQNKNGIKSIDTREAAIRKNRDLTKMLLTVILVIIASSAVLTVTVIYNITSINIFERTREMATLMVLGYYKSEINRLIFAENLVLTIIGCIIGLPAGVFTFRYLIGLINSSDLSLPNSADIRLLLLTAAITLIFTFAANFISRSRLRKIVMVEALKSIE